MIIIFFSDLKRSLVDDSNLAGNDEEAVKIVQKPIVPVPKPKEILPLATPDESLTSSDFVNSVASSMTNLDNPMIDVECAAAASMKHRKRSFITGSKDHSEFRKRVMSSDSIQAERNRCRSMDNAGEGNNCSTNPKSNQNQPRPRTQTHSQIQRIKQVILS